MIDIIRDHENDVLYVVPVGSDVRNIVNYAYNENILIRIDVVMQKVVGLTIEEFMEEFPEYKNLGKHHLMIKFGRLLGLINFAAECDKRSSK